MKRTSKSMNSRTTNFGWHLTIDGYDCDKKLLGDMDYVFRVLDDLPVFLNMRKLITPYVVKAPENNKKDPGGYSGFVMIQESHISVHTFPERRFVSVDVYSCRDFDTKKTEKYLIKTFRIKDAEVNLVKRGTRYPLRNM